MKRLMPLLLAALLLSSCATTEDTYDIAVIAVSVKDDYIGFELKRRDYRIEDFGVKRKTEIDEFALIQLPVKNRENFGEWLNVMWDDEVAVNLLATHPATRIDAFRENGYTTLYAGLDYDVKFMGAGAALRGDGFRHAAGCAEPVVSGIQIFLL